MSSYSWLCMAQHQADKAIMDKQPQRWATVLYFLRRFKSAIAGKEDGTDPRELHQYRALLLQARKGGSNG